MTLLDILKKKPDDSIILELLQRGVSKLGNAVGQQQISVPYNPFQYSPTIGQVANTLIPNSAIGAFIRGDSEAIIPNIVSTLKTQGENAQTPEGMLSMVAGAVDFPAAIAPKLIQAIKTSRSATELGRVLSKDRELVKKATDIFKDKTNSINNLDDLFKAVKPPTPPPVAEAGFYDAGKLQQSISKSQNSEYIKNTQYALNFYKKAKETGSYPVYINSAREMDNLIAKTEQNLVRGQSSSTIPNKAAKIENYSDTGVLADNQSTFFAPKGTGATDYGSKKITDTIDESKLFIAPDSVTFAEKAGYINKPDKWLKEKFGYDTLAKLKAAEIDGFPQGTKELQENPNAWYRAFQTKAKEYLQDKGYAGIKYISEDDLTPVQYQIWDKSVLKSRVAQPTLSLPQPTNAVVKGGVGESALSQEIRRRVSPIPNLSNYRGDGLVAEVESFGKRSYLPLLEEYKGKQIVQAGQDVAVWNPKDPKGGLFRVALDDSKMSGDRAIIESANNIEGAKKYIDWLSRNETSQGLLKSSLPQPTIGGLPPEVATSLREAKGLSAQDIVAKHPNINLKRDVPVTDIYGNKVTIPEGEALTPYEMKGNKVLLQDGETYIVSKNQFQNIKGQSLTGEAKEFAPELGQTEETVRGWRKNDVTYSDIAKYAQDHNVSESHAALELRGQTLVPQNPTKFSQYTLPGGENYKEVLIKAPSKIEAVGELPGGYGINETGRGYEVIDKERKVISSARTEEEATQKAIDLINKTNNVFKSSHWDEPNVISHLRLNERTYKGKKVTFMEEAQSDWAREARTKKGVEETAQLLSKEQVGANDYKFNFSAPNSTAIDTITAPTEQQARLLLYGEEGITKHPLLKNWQELSVKRGLKDAVDNNSEYFSWINGEQTSARYNLATHIDEANWVRPPEAPTTEKFVSIKPIGKTEIYFRIKNDGTIIRGQSQNVPEGWQGKKLDEVLGKGLADKIMAQEKGTLSGEGLKFGGEWANNLYDKQIKNIVEDVTGGKVETLDMGLPIDGKKTIVWLAEPHTDWGQRIPDMNTGKKLTLENMKVSQEVHIGSDGQMPHETHIITDILGDGKFKAVEKKYYNNKKEFPNLSHSQTFDISTKKSSGQQAIKITPEIRAIVKGEAPPMKQPSGLTPFEQRIKDKLERKER